MFFFKDEIENLVALLLIGIIPVYYFYGDENIQKYIAGTYHGTFVCSHILNRTYIDSDLCQSSRVGQISLLLSGII